MKFHNCNIGNNIKPEALSDSNCLITLSWLSVNECMLSVANAIMADDIATVVDDAAAAVAATVTAVVRIFRVATATSCARAFHAHTYS